MVVLCCCVSLSVPGPCDPEDLLDGVIFGAKYLGSTQIKSEKKPSTNARMTQAQEAVDRIKVDEEALRGDMAMLLPCYSNSLSVCSRLRRASPSP